MEATVVGEARGMVEEQQQMVEEHVGFGYDDVYQAVNESIDIMDNTMEDAMEDAMEGGGGGKETMRYIAEMNRANVDGGAVPMDTTTTSLVGAKNTMGQTKQWQTLESIAL